MKRLDLNSMFHTVGFVSILMLTVLQANAGAPQIINYQGKLTDNSGNPITGTESLTFVIENSGGAAVRTIGPISVTPTNGVFNVQLPISAADFQDPDLYLKVKIGANSFPRQRLLASPYALAVSADSVGSGEIVNGSIALADLNPAVFSPGNIGAGSLDSDVIASSIAVNAVQDASIVGVSPSKISAGSLDSDVIASSIAVNAVQDAAIVGVSPSKISAGSLDSDVIASSIAVNAVLNASIVGVSPSKISAGSLGALVMVSSVAAGAVKDLSIDSVSATKITGGTFGTGQNVGIGGVAGTEKLTITGTMKVTSNAEIAGSLKVGSGTKIVKYISETCSMFVGKDISNGNSESEDCTLPGADFGDVVLIGAPKLKAGILVFGYVDASNKIKVTVANVGGGANVNINGNYRVSVIQH